MGKYCIYFEIILAVCRLLRFQMKKKKYIHLQVVGLLEECFISYLLLPPSGEHLASVTMEKD